MRSLFLVATLLAPAPVFAQTESVKTELLKPVKMVRFARIGGHRWEPGEAFRTLGTSWCDNGQFVDAAVLPARKEVRVVCSDYGTTGKKYTVRVLGADAREIAGAPLSSTDTTGAVFGNNVAWIERGKAEPLAVTWESYRARAWNEKGKAVDLPLASGSGVGALAVLGTKDGGPLIVIGHGWGDVGLEAFRPDGKRVWATADVTDVRGLASTRLDGKPVLGVWYATSRLALIGPDGKVRERASPGGNSDRLLVDDGKEKRLYTFDSGAGSKRETLRVMTTRKGKEGGRWEETASADLGPITVTGYALGRFDAGKPPRVVAGTSNGWVFLLDAAGAPVASTKFLSPVRSLWASDLTGDGRDELVVIIEGASDNVVIFTPGALP